MLGGCLADIGDRRGDHGVGTVGRDTDVIDSQVGLLQGDRAEVIGPCVIRTVAVAGARVGAVSREGDPLILALLGHKAQGDGDRLTGRQRIDRFARRPLAVDIGGQRELAGHIVSGVLQRHLEGDRMAGGDVQALCGYSAVDQRLALIGYAGDPDIREHGASVRAVDDRAALIVEHIRLVEGDRNVVCPHGVDVGQVVGGNVGKPDARVLNGALLAADGIGLFMNRVDPLVSHVHVVLIQADDEGRGDRILGLIVHDAGDDHDLFTGVGGIGLGDRLAVNGDFESLAHGFGQDVGDDDQIGSVVIDSHHHVMDGVRVGRHLFLVISLGDHGIGGAVVVGDGESRDIGTGRGIDVGRCNAPAGSAVAEIPQEALDLTVGVIAARGVKDDRLVDDSVEVHARVGGGQGVDHALRAHGTVLGIRRGTRAEFIDARGHLGVGIKVDIEVYELDAVRGHGNALLIHEDKVTGRAADNRCAEQIDHHALGVLAGVIDSRLHAERNGIVLIVVLSGVIEHRAALHLRALGKIRDIACLELGDRGCGAVHHLIIPWQDIAVRIAEDLIHNIEQILRLAVNGVGILPVVREGEGHRLAAVVRGVITVYRGDILTGKIFGFAEHQDLIPECLVRFAVSVICGRRREDIAALTALAAAESLGDIHTDADVGLSVADRLGQSVCPDDDLHRIDIFAGAVVQNLHAFARDDMGVDLLDQRVELHALIGLVGDGRGEVVDLAVNILQIILFEFGHRPQDGEVTPNHIGQVAAVVSKAVVHARNIAEHQPEGIGVIRAEGRADDLPLGAKSGGIGHDLELAGVDDHVFRGAGAVVGHRNAHAEAGVRIDLVRQIVVHREPRLRVDVDLDRVGGRGHELAVDHIGDAGKDLILSAGLTAHTDPGDDLPLAGIGRAGGDARGGGALRLDDIHVVGDEGYLVRIGIGILDHHLGGQALEVIARIVVGDFQLSVERLAFERRRL